MRFDSILVQGAHNPTDNRSCITVPLYQTTAYSFESVQYSADLFDLKCSGDIYTRISNPTTQVLEERIAMLEDGVGALCTASGMAASTIAVLNLTKSGDEIVASSSLYGGTHNLLGYTLERLGIKTTFVNSDDITNFEKAINEKTKCVYIEMIGNPKLDVADVEGIAKIAHSHNIPLIIDNTIATPYLCKPVSFGADIIIHSLTKYLSGHGNVLGGVIVDSGNFDWKQSGKFSQFTEPDESYHGLIYAKEFGKAAYIMRARANLLRDLGSTLAPQSALMVLTGMETLHLRMERHSQSALEVAKFLNSHQVIEWVNYPLLQTSQYYNLAQKYLRKGASSILTFGVKGGAEAGVKLLEKVKLAIHATNIGDARTIITYPCLTTHRQLDDAQLKACGISKNFIRLSVGLEDIDDIKEDLNQALK